MEGRVTFAGTAPPFFLVICRALFDQAKEKERIQSPAIAPPASTCATPEETTALAGRRLSTTDYSIRAATLIPSCQNVSESSR